MQVDAKRSCRFGLPHTKCASARIFVPECWHAAGPPLSRSPTRTPAHPRARAQVATAAPPTIWRCTRSSTRCGPPAARRPAHAVATPTWFTSAVLVDFGTGRQTCGGTKCELVSTGATHLSRPQHVVTMCTVIYTFLTTCWLSLRSRSTPRVLYFTHAR